MKNFLRQSLAKKVILFGFIIGLVSPSAMAYVDGGYPVGTLRAQPIELNSSLRAVDPALLVAVVAPSVQNLNVSTATGSADVSFSLNTNATATVWIKDTTDTIVKTLIFDNNLSGGTVYSYTWNGTDNNGQKVANGSYKAQVVAYNTVSSDIESYSFNFTSGSVVTAPDVTASVSPSSFEPTKGQTTTFSYSLNTAASLKVEVKLNGAVVKTLRAQSQQAAGSYQLLWNGTNDSNVTMSPNTYNIEVYASNTAGTDLALARVNITNTPVEVAPVVSVSASPVSFDPTKGQSTTATYTLNTTANLRVDVKQGSTVVKTLRGLSEQTAGTYSLVWDGSIYNANPLAPVGAYTIEVYATNNAGSDTDTTTVNVITSNTTTAPNVTNLYATPTPFNPSNENTRVYFTTDKTADVTVSILDGSSTVKNLVSGTSLSAGTYYYEWNGRDSNGYTMADKVYTARVTASNTAGSDTESTSVEVKTSGSGTCDLITSHYVNPTTFDPDERDALISYTLARSAEVTVRIKDGSTTIRTLVDHQSQNSGSKTVSWNGHESDGDHATDGYYTYEITAYVSGCSTDVESSSVRVDNNGTTDDEDDWDSTDEDLITDVTVRNEVFDPTDGERSTVEFTLDRRADLIVQVMDGSHVVETLRDADDQAGGDYSYSWDGRDSDNDIMDDDVYQFRIMADDGDDTDTDRAYTEVDTDGIIIGFPDSDRCAGYRDVSINSPFCKAIELMSERGIFEGYSDGTFRPYAKINRAETVKVVTLALGYDVNTGGTYNLGYRDTSSTAWYSPYLYVAKRENIATGYPDNTFRPSSTINRVELLRVFLEGNQTDDLFSCSPQPFDDTPITSDTRWYMKYACYAQDHDLMDSGYNNNLYPAEAMTRGDVADLFYDFEVKGLYSDYVLDRTGNGDNHYVCVEYDHDDDCVRYESTADRYTYNYSNNDSNDGYYVYRNGRYVWVSY